jgi:hypothetical protein
MTITDEIVKKAEDAYDSFGDPEAPACDPPSMRAALEAVAPMLIAQGMREAADVCDANWIDEEYAKRRILARAQELDSPLQKEKLSDFKFEDFEEQQPGDPTNPFQRRNIGPPGPDPFGGRFSQPDDDCRQAADRLAFLSEEREALLGENARLVGIINFMTAANRAQELDPQHSAPVHGVPGP